MFSKGFSKINVISNHWLLRSKILRIYFLIKFLNNFVINIFIYLIITSILLLNLKLLDLHLVLELRGIFSSWPLCCYRTCLNWILKSFIILCLLTRVKLLTIFLLSLKLLLKLKSINIIIQRFILFELTLLKLLCCIVLVRVFRSILIEV